MASEDLMPDNATTSPMTNDTGLVERLRVELAEAQAENTRWLWRFSEIREASGVGHKPRLGELPAAIASRIEALEAEVALLRSPQETDQWRLDGSANVDLAFKVETIRRSLQYWLSWDRRADHKPDDTVTPPTWPTRAVIAIWVMTLQEAEQATRSQPVEGDG